MEDTKDPSPSPEKAAPRQIADIQKDYELVSSKAGDFSYKIACMEQDLQRMYQKMYELNQEGKDAGMPPETLK